MRTRQEISKHISVACNTVWMESFAGQLSQITQFREFREKRFHVLNARCIN